MIRFLIIIVIAIILGVIASFGNDNNIKSNHIEHKNNSNDDDFFEDYIIFDMINKNRK